MAEAAAEQQRRRVERPDGERFSLGAFVENLTDESYYTGTQENFGASGIRLKPHQRVIGAFAEVRF